MAGIVCAIRGGPASLPTIGKAIDLALETGSPLYFLYVVNLKFLSHTSSSRTHIISKELNEMGEFILLTAQTEAQKKGIKAEGVVRQGIVRDEIVNLCKTVEAQYVVLGKPNIETEARNVFSEDRLNAFEKRIQDESGAKIILA
jgi:nucleotide-binding universal stress UspA family protein